VPAGTPTPGRKRVGGQRGDGGVEWSEDRVRGRGVGGISRWVGGGRGFLQKSLGLLVKMTPTSNYRFMA
jgi:hypothetical protein